MKSIALFLLALTFALPATAELYRWTDNAGHVHYSDQPPPPSVKQIKRISSPNVESGDPAKSGAPVTLYSGNCGPTCDQAADYLRQRGVPFTLKNADKDPKLAQELKKRTGAMEIPVLFVGESMQRGYSPSVWDKMLEVAGYPAPAPAQPSQEQSGPLPTDQPKN
ncbi:MAG: glutaredoxin family protein [Parasulfuritortus sp.]|jgi:glutaredoxin|nr:glutaredoxin family protein [Parasulfuritortus sp.]